MQKVKDTEFLPFASASLSEHLLRGALAFGAITLAIYLFGSSGSWLTIAFGGLLIAFAFLMFRGCPVCWTIGLFGVCNLKKPDREAQGN